MGDRTRGKHDLVARVHVPDSIAANRVKIDAIQRRIGDFEQPVNRRIGGGIYCCAEPVGRGGEAEIDALGRIGGAKFSVTYPYLLQRQMTARVLKVVEMSDQAERSQIGIDDDGRGRRRRPGRRSRSGTGQQGSKGKQ